MAAGRFGIRKMWHGRCSGGVTGRGSAGKGQYTMLKKMVLVCGVLILAVGCRKNSGNEHISDFNCSNYEKLDFKSVSVPEGVEAFAVCENGDIIYSRADEKMYQCDSNGNKEELQAGLLYGNFCVDGKNVYAYDYVNSSIVQVEKDGNFVEDPRKIQNTIAFHTIRNMVVVDEEIYVLAVPFTADNRGDFFAFGKEDFEYYGETVYLINTQSGQYKTLDLGHIMAEYRSEDGRLFFMVGRRKNIICTNTIEKKKKSLGSLHLIVWETC